MKKLLALVLSVMMVLSLSVVAFATEVGDPNTTPGQTDVDNNTNKNFELGFGDLGKEAGNNPDKPGATYYFTIMDKNNQNSADKGMLTNDDIAKHLTVSIREAGDKMIDSYAIVKKNSVYKVEVKTKTTYTTSKTSATWTIQLKRDKKYKAAEAEVEIAQKWAELTNGVDPVNSDANQNSDNISTSGEEAEYIVYQDEVFDPSDALSGDRCDNYTDDANEEVLVKMAKGVKYAEIYFDGSNVWYSVKNSSASTVNGHYTLNNKKMSQTYGDADLEMIFFDGTPEFDYTGTLHASVDEDMFVYLVDGGKLVEGKFTWNKEVECWETNSRKIEGVVISDIKLDVSKYNSTVNTGDDNKGNPGTGSVDFVNVAVALGVVSLAAAGAVALKK